MDRDQTGDGGFNRRRILKMIGLGSASAAAPFAASETAEAMRATPDMRAPRYRETDHIRKFYQTNRR